MMMTALTAQTFNADKRKERSSQPSIRYFRAACRTRHHDGVTESAESREVFRDIPFPFPNDEFPADLGAVIQRTVFCGEQPAREVIHDADNGWAVGDGVNDPNEPGAVVVGHMRHVVEQNSSVASLAAMPPGHIATREDPGRPWEITPHRYVDEE